MSTNKSGDTNGAGADPGSGSEMRNTNIAREEEQQGTTDASHMLNHAAAAAAAAADNDTESASIDGPHKTPSISVHSEEARPASRVYINPIPSRWCLHRKVQVIHERQCAKASL